MPNCIHVEFFGIPRERAGVAKIDVEATSVGEVIRQLPTILPGLVECIHGDELRKGYLASINGQQFTTNAQTPLQQGDSLLILSADVGG